MGLYWIQLVLSIDVLECLVIGMQDNGPRVKVMAPMSGSYHNSTEFLIIGAIVASRAIELLKNIGNRPLGLD